GDGFVGFVGGGDSGRADLGDHIARAEALTGGDAVGGNAGDDCTFGVAEADFVGDVIGEGLELQTERFGRCGRGGGFVAVFGVLVAVTAAEGGHVFWLFADFHGRGLVLPVAENAEGDFGVGLGGGDGV